MASGTADERRDIPYEVSIVWRSSLELYTMYRWFLCGYRLEIKDKRACLSWSVSELVWLRLAYDSRVHVGYTYIVSAPRNFFL